MKRILSLLLLTVLGLAGAASARADEDDQTQLEFVRRLRERRMAPLALEYLSKLQKTGSAALKKLIPVEVARTKISMAREMASEQRKKLFEEARVELENYARANEGSPAAAQARLEKARVATYEGQALLSQANRAEDRVSILDLARKAEEHYKLAGGELAAAAKALTQPQDQLMVKFEVAKNLLDQAQTILDRSRQAESTRRALLLDEARKALEAIEKDAGKDEKAEALHLARAWLFRLYKGENLDTAKTKYYLNKVLNADAAEAASGQRLVKAYQIQHIMKDPDLKGTPHERVKMVQKEALDWLKIYRGQNNTADGIAVRFALASAYLAESNELKAEVAKASAKNPKAVKDKKKLATAEALADKALRWFTTIADSDNDFTEEATRYQIALNIRRMGEKTPVEQLKNADECFLKARFELYKSQETAAQLARVKDSDKRKELEEQKEEHENNVIKAFRRGIDMAEKDTTLKDRVKKIAEARYYLTYFYLLLNTPQASAAAAALGEKVARANVQTKFSAATAGYAVEAYTRLMSGDKAKAARKQFLAFADFLMTKRADLWKGEPVLQIVRYQQAMACLREKADVQNDLTESDPEKKYQKEVDWTKKAIKLFGKLDPSFRGYQYAQCQGAYAALLGMKNADKNLERDPKKIDPKKNAEKIKDRTYFKDEFEKIMQGLKGVSANTDAGTVQLYFSVQLEQGNMLFAEAASLLAEAKTKEAVAKYKALGQFTARMEKEYALAGKALNDDLRGNFQLAMTALDYRVRLGLGQVAYQESKYQEVLSPAIAQPVVAAVRQRGQAGAAAAARLAPPLAAAEKALAANKDAGKAEPLRERVEALRKQRDDAQAIVLRDDRVIANLLGLAMRADVQVGKVPEALDVLGLLLRVRPERGALDPVAPELEIFIRELREQVKTLKAARNEKKLAATVKNFSLFLDKLKEEQGRLNQKSDFIFLANSYASLGKHAEAVKYLEKVERPKIDHARKLDKLDKKELQELQRYWLMRVLYGTELRLNKDLKKAKEVLEGVQTDPQSMAKFLGQKELLHVEEDAGRFGNAVIGWRKFINRPELIKGMSDPGKTVAEQRRNKALYFECYYHLTYSTFMYGKLGAKTREKQEQWYKIAADYITRLENSPNREGWEVAGPRFLELIRAEPLLYERLPDLTKKYNIPKNFTK